MDVGKRGISRSGDGEDGETANHRATPTVDPNDSDADDQRIIRAEEVKTIAKRRLKLSESLKKGYATVYDQCSREVRDKLKGTDDWESIQKDQLLHELINKIERICVGFDDHKRSSAEDTVSLLTNGQGDRRAIRSELSCIVGDGGGVRRLPRSTSRDDQWDAKRSHVSSKCGETNGGGNNEGRRRRVGGGEGCPGHQWGRQDKIWAAERQASQ